MLNREDLVRNIKSLRLSWLDYIPSIEHDSTPSHLLNNEKIGARKEALRSIGYQTDMRTIPITKWRGKMCNRDVRKGFGKKDKAHQGL